MRAAAKVRENAPENKPLPTVTTGETRSGKTGSAPKAPIPAVLAQSEAENLNLLGQVSYLMSQSAPHKHLFFADLDSRIRPPLLLRQCRMFRRDNRPCAFVTWAYVSDEVAERLQAAPARLRPTEWRCGKRAVLIDIIAPFGGADDCARQAMDAAIKGLEKPADAPSA